MKIVFFQSLILIGICSLIGLLSNAWWFFDLFNHFRPQALLCSVVIFISALIIRDSRNAWLALAIIALNASLMAERLYLFPASETSTSSLSSEKSTQTISVLFSNVLTSNSLYKSVLDAVSQHHPDILVTTEIDKNWASALTPLQSAYPHSVLVTRTDNFGMAIYSKLPFKSERYDVGDYKLPLMVLDFDTFILIAAHPIPPLADEKNKELHTYMSKIAEIVRDTKKPVVLTGDFNATIWSNTINALRDLGLERTNPFGFAWTWPSNFWPLAVQIDHIFVRDAAAADFQVLGFVGSDHFPVKSTITIHTD